MPVEIDPEGREIKVLEEAASFVDRHVLEVGCGDGRLTWRYADKPAHVTAIDPDQEALSRALRNCPPHLQGRIDFVQAKLEEFTPEGERSEFDIVLFAWSLASIEPARMGDALRRAHSLLRPDGTLIDNQSAPRRRVLQVHSGDQVTQVGNLRDELDFEDVKVARKALTAAVAQGLFTDFAERVLDGYVYADSLEELRQAIPGVLVDGEQASRVARIMAETEVGSKVAQQVWVRVVSLRPVGRSG